MGSSRIKKASTLQEIPNAFRDEPLDGDDILKFYKDTIETRTGENGVSPMRYIYRSCTNPGERKAFLLMGHRGCGKSTELNHLAMQLNENDYPVRTIYCSQELDRLNMVYSDILILMAEALVSLADELIIKISNKDLTTLLNFRQEIEKEDIVTKDADLAAEGGLSLESPKILSGLLGFFFSVKSSLKYNRESRITIREKVEKRISEWIAAINSLADQITAKKDGKQPILIFEDLDKGNTWDVFHSHCEQLTATTFPTIFTFPVGLSYSPEFSEMDGFFTAKRLPMIKTQKITGDSNPEGIAIIHSIIESRADSCLFGKNVIDHLIAMTGGSLRDLFNAILEAAFISMERDQSSISMDAAQIALRELRSSLKIRIDASDYPFLRSVYEDHLRITDNTELLRMMQAGVVLEYNGDLWYNLHPMIADYLISIGELNRERK